MSRTARIVLPLASFVGLVILWGVVTTLGGFTTDVFPGPVETAKSFWELVSSGALLAHAVASLFRVTVGTYLAILLGFPLGMLLGYWKPGQVVFGPLIDFLRPISPLAWIPLAMLWFGIGDPPAVFLIFLAAFFTVLLPTIAAVNGLPSTYYRVASNFDFTKLELFRFVIFPAILPRILPALRVSVGIAWLVVVAAEMIAVKSGLGFLILDSRNALRMDFVLVAMVAIGLIGIALDTMIGRLSNIRSVNWDVAH